MLFKSCFLIWIFVVWPVCYPCKKVFINTSGLSVQYVERHYIVCGGQYNLVYESFFFSNGHLRLTWTNKAIRDGRPRPPRHQCVYQISSWSVEKWLRYYTEILRKHGQTHRQTDRHGHYNTSPSPYGGRHGHYNTSPSPYGGRGKYPKKYCPAGCLGLAYFVRGLSEPRLKCPPDNLTRGPCLFTTLHTKITIIVINMRWFTAGVWHIFIRIISA